MDTSPVSLTCPTKKSKNAGMWACSDGSILPTYFSSGVKVARMDQCIRPILHKVWICRRNLKIPQSSPLAHYHWWVQHSYLVQILWSQLDGEESSPGYTPGLHLSLELGILHKNKGFFGLILCWSSQGHCSGTYFRWKLHICRDFYIILMVLCHLHFSSSLDAKLFLWRANIHEWLATCSPIFNGSETMTQYSKILLGNNILSIHRYNIMGTSMSLNFSFYSLPKANIHLLIISSVSPLQR